MLVLEFNATSPPLAFSPLPQAEPAQLEAYGVQLGRDYPRPVVDALDNGRLPLRAASATFDKGKPFHGPKWMKDKSVEGDKSKRRNRVQGGWQ